MIYVEPVPDAWWHSPEMVSALWGAIAILVATIGYLLRQWRHDRVMLRELKVKVDELPNAQSFGDLKRKLDDIHDWWMENVVNKPRRRT